MNDDVTCWWCGVEPDDTYEVDDTRLCSLPQTIVYWAAGRLRGLADRLDPPGPQTVHDEINLSPEAADALYRVAERYNGRVKACAENPYAVGLPEFGNESSPAPYIGARAQRLSRP